MRDSPFSVNPYGNFYLKKKKKKCQVYPYQLYLDATHSYLSDKQRLSNYHLKQMQNCKWLYQIMGNLCSLNAMFHHCIVPSLDHGHIFCHLVYNK